ncbi:hypothetical protein N0V83_009668 [Neocucurbitaria cava]|uniref:Ubiquitin carboxyl-terminal hydrolase 19 n=1 Tax=Neocucurbitaria cava TaxID=798079 RepID=A0A9W9CI28_9PLEO|nr:hypothetical protein N0V83_009668 [Neocucurbitaria cava]
MGGHVMSERSYSHKSDGRQSSAGHSVHSATSGRANSLTGFGSAVTLDPPGLAPGLFILGSVPAIIRCWLNTNFKHDTLLYAAVCSGSYTSFLEYHLVERLGFQDHIVTTDKGVRKIKLSVYLPEAVPVSASSRSNSPTPQLPSVGIDFTVVDEYNAEANPKAIQVFLGSDMLRAHNADLLFSANQLTLYDDDRTKLQIPLVRPEDEHSFKSLHISNGPRLSMELEDVTGSAPMQSQRNSSHESSTRHTTRKSASVVSQLNDVGTANSSDDGGSSGRRSFEQRVQAGQSSSIRPDTRDGQDSNAANGPPRSEASQAIWSNWRRGQGEKGNGSSLDWANVGKTSSSTQSSQRRETGIKVLKPSKPARTASASIPSPGAGQSRFFDDGNRREDEGGTSSAPSQIKRTVSGEKGKETTPTLTKTRSSNPIGGASAFAWLNSGGSK